MHVIQAPFETFEEHRLREDSDDPYNEEYIRRCKDAVSRYEKKDDMLRPSLLSDLRMAVPRHFQRRVFG